MKKAIKMIAGACAAAVVCAGGLLYYNLSRQNVRHTSATFVMDAVADQKVYGPNGEKAIAAAEQAFREMENRLSVYKEGSDIARLNAAAGSGEAVAVEAQTYALLSQAKTLSAASAALRLVCQCAANREKILRQVFSLDELYMILLRQPLVIGCQKLDLRLLTPRVFLRIGHVRIIKKDGKVMIRQQPLDTSRTAGTAARMQQYAQFFFFSFRLQGIDRCFRMFAAERVNPSGQVFLLHCRYSSLDNL